MTDEAPRELLAPRPLNEPERRVLDSLLAQDFTGAEALRGQVSHAQVVGACTCGCVTVDLAVDKEMAESTSIGGRPIRSEAAILNDADEPIGGVIIFLRDGYLRTLEAYSYGDPISAWPDANRMTVFLHDD